MSIWEKSNAYKRILEILDDYWLSQPNEKAVKVDMYFEHMNGEKQEKHIIWRNPNLKVKKDMDRIEQAVLGSCLVYESSIDYVVEHCTSNAFTNPYHRIIYKAMIDEYWRGVTPPAVACRLKDDGNYDRVGGAVYLTVLMERSATPSKLPDCVKELNERVLKIGENKDE